MNLKETRQIMRGIFGAMLLSLLIGAISGIAFFAVLGTVLLLVFMGFSLSRWRCPYCGEPMSWNPKDTCPFCGRELEDLKTDTKEDAKPKQDT